MMGLPCLLHHLRSFNTSLIGRAEAGEPAWHDMGFVAISQMHTRNPAPVEQIIVEKTWISELGLLTRGI